ncbi:MAG: hypothetical protein ACXV5Q_11580 [Frankiaceae bacterium]
MFRRTPSKLGSTDRGRQLPGRFLGRRGFRFALVALALGITLAATGCRGASRGNYGQWASNVAPSVATIAQRFSCLPATYPGHDPDQWHAADFMVYGNSAKGHQIADFVVANAGWLRVKYMGWWQHYWSPQTGWRAMANRGSPTQNHMDHVHVTFLY